ncbi:MAG: hypothetical protein NTV46_09180, partial [Verrucomicrobia bacterium]|nr:hypothetical protein [Verrucomicrobiota bacterium]
VLTRQELHDIGFPTDMEKDHDHIFAVFSLEENPEFAHLKWDSDGLNVALTRFLNRQRPSYRRLLSRLTRDIAKPWLVSLADLQLAIKAPADEIQE